jgi:hypothetical protein
VNKLTREKKKYEKRITPTDFRMQKRKNVLVYDGRFETGEICKELLWVRNGLKKKKNKCEKNINIYII